MKKLSLLILLLLAGFMFLPTPVCAGELDTERQVQHDLLLSQAMLRKIAARQQAGQPVTGEIARLKSLAGTIGKNHQLLRERFAARDSVAGGLGPVAAARHTAMQEGYLAFLDEYLGIIKNLPDDTVPAYLLDSLNSRLKSLLPDHPVPLLGALPYRHLRWPGQLPATSPEIVPAYLGGDRTVRPADLAASPEAVLSTEIIALAQSLHWSPVEIYGWVKNNIKSEWYWGVMKGAGETLRQGSGNDADQAALLVALLRAAGYPALFVRGTIEFFPDPTGILAQTGVSDTQALAIFFQKAGIPCQPVIRGGRIANLQIEHIWVEAEIPYANYRGVVLDDQGKTWLALDTQIKSAGVTVNQPPALPAGVDLAALRDQYLAADRPESPLEYLRAAFTAAGSDYTGLLHQRSTNGELIQILPASLQFEKISVTGEYNTLPESLIHRVHLTASHNGASLFTGTLPLADLSNRSLAIIYEPATVEDQEIINSYGGLANTPAYLVQLRPVLTVDGRRTLIGTSGLPVGSDFTLAVELITPNQSERVENALTIGNLAVLGLVAQEAVVVAEPPAGEITAEWLLHERALAYIDEWNAAEEELAALLNLPLLRPLPTLVTLGGVVEVTWLLDTPHGIEWRGVSVDADLRAVELGEAADKQKIFMRLSGLQGSVLEERVLSEGFGVASLSTAKVLGLSNGEGLAPLLLTKANLETTLPGLGLPANAVADITSAVFQGRQVTIPPSPSLYEDWQGIGYRTEDPESGEAGWMLSGLIAGGMTATNPERWPLDGAAEVLANPFSDPPNRDPGAALFIQKITATDLQVGTVGQPLPKKLQVYVTDRNHKPVKGAEVIFTVKAGGGTLAGQAMLTATTDHNGVAEVALTCGQHTADNPGFWLENDTTYSQQVGENLVGASLASGPGLASPFTALAKPAAPDHLVRTSGGDGWGMIFSWSGPVGLIVADHYGNSIANQPVSFTAETPVNRAACDNPGSDPAPALLAAETEPCIQDFPVYGDGCGTPSLTTLSDYKGTHAQVILGPMPGAMYRITARAGALTTSFDWYSWPEVDCDNTDPPIFRLRIDLQYQGDQFGNLIDAGPVGSPVPVKASCKLLQENGTTNGDGTYYLDNAKIMKVGMGSPPRAMAGNGQGMYSGLYTLAAEPGINEVVVTCSTEISEKTYTVYDTMQVAGVAVRFPYQADGSEPAGAVVVPVDEQGFLASDQVLSYQIKPAEYRAGAADLFVYHDGELLFVVPTEKTGIGFATLARGLWFALSGNYEAEVVLNPGSGVEIRSERIPLKIVPMSISIEIEDNKYPIPIGETVQALAVTVPAGRPVVWSEQPSDDGVSAKIDPESGLITVAEESRSGWFTFRATDREYPDVYKDAKVYVGCSACGDNSCALPGKEFVELSSIDIRINIGKDLGGQSAGELFIRGEIITPALFTPKALEFASLRGPEVLRDKDGVLRQILAADAFVDIVVLTDSSYEIRFYRAADVLAQKTEDTLYQVADPEATLLVWRIEKPGAAGDPLDTLHLTQLKQGVVTKGYTYHWDESANRWELEKGDGLQVSSKEITLDQGKGTRTETVTVRDGSGSAASVVKTIFGSFPWGEEIIAETVDPDGAAMTTTTDYYTDADLPGYGQIHGRLNPDGSWARYEYDGLGRKSREVRSWLAAPFVADAEVARATEYEYAPIAPADTDSPRDVQRPRTVIEKILGVVVSRRYFVYQRGADGSLLEISEQAASAGASYGDAGNLRTATTYSPSGTGRADSGKIASVLGPDGSLTTYTYEFGSYASVSGRRGTFTPGDGRALRRTVIHGTASQPAGIAHKTTSDTSIADKFGNPVEQDSAIYTGSGYEPYQWSVNTLDDFGRVVKNTSSDGTASATVWGCCAKESDTDRNGITTSYTYDTLNRPTVTSREGLHGPVTTTVTYDAAGRRLTQTVAAQGLSQFSEHKYDSAGRLDYSIDAAGLLTDYDYDPSGLITTVTRPGGATETTENYPDGLLKSVTGSGVVARYYEYGVNPDGSQWTTVRSGRPDSPRWEKSTTDLMGRTVLTEKPGYNGNTFTTQSFYNDLGHLIRTETTGRAATVYEYDGLGQQYRSGLDIDGNSNLDLAALDRITESDSQYVKIGSDWWQESSQYVYARANSATRTRTASQRSRLSGLGGGLVGESVSVDGHGNQTVSRSFLDPANRRHTSTVTSPESVNPQTSVSEYGLLVATTDHAGLTVSFDYDVLGRRTGSTDPRTGTSLTHYDTAGRVDYLEDAAGYRTWFGYDPTSGRKSWERNGLDKYTRYAYDDRDQLTRTWGEAAYPLSYEYDDYGQRTRMSTYRSGSGWEGTAWPADPGPADLTIWQYDEASGLLAAKEDAAGKQVTYAYTPAGQLQSRTWARLEHGDPLVTTYLYDPKAAELTDIVYSDTTVDIGFSYDRLGRQETITDAVGARTFTYNSALQLESEAITGLYDKTITRNYEASGVVGRTTGFNVGGEYAATYGYDPLTGRFASVSWDVGGVTGSTNYGYLPNSNLLQQATFSNGQVTTYSYEPNRNLKTRVENRFGATLISQYDYSYDALSRRKEVRNSGSAFTEPAFNLYGYNDRSELTASNRYLGSDVADTSRPVAAEDRAYAYDPIGNRQKTTAWDQANAVRMQLTYTANQLNQYDLISADMGKSNESPTYDDDGNMSGYSGKVYSYNAENRLVAAEPRIPAEGGIKSEYVYDYMGRRGTKKVETYSGGSWMPTSESLYIYDGWNLIAEMDGSGNPTASYVWGLDLSQSLQGAGGVGGLLVRVQENGYVSYAFDANGNAGQLLDGAVGIAGHYEYDPYGNTIRVSGKEAEANPFRFSTKYFVDETELYDYGNRYYSPELGRWINRDPIEELGGINLYSFVQNNPVNWVDPFGLYTEVINWDPIVGQVKSGFGHVSVNLNGTSYSFGPHGMDIRPIDDYLRLNNFRMGTGAVLNLSTWQESVLKRYLDDPGDYGRLSNNCGSPVQRGLDALGVDVGDNVLPVDLAIALFNSGAVIRYNTYLPK